MTTDTGPERSVVPRVILQDRWDSVMEWSRTGGNASRQYLALVESLSDLIAVVVGCPEDEVDEAVGRSVLDDDFLFAIGDEIVGRVHRLGIAR